MNTKDSMFILAIVGIVAIVGLIVLITGTRTGSMNAYEDSAGQVSRSRLAAGYCGDGIRGDSEQCDGNDLGGTTCTDIGNFIGGTLGCTSYCTFDTSDCQMSESVCGNGIREDPEMCDGTDFGWMTCESFGFGGGYLLCDADCEVDTSQCVFGTNATITEHRMDVYGSKSYRFDTMQYNYYMGAQASVETSEPIEAVVNVQCNQYSNDQSTGMYAYSDGATASRYEFSNPSMTTYGASQGGINFDGTPAWCYSWASIFQGPNHDMSITFNPDGNSYPSINSAAIYKSSLTNQYFVYFDANNYNGGICKLSYYIGTQYSEQYVWWEMELPNCPTEVSYLAPINFTEPIISGEQVWLSLMMRPSLDEGGYGIYTEGSGSYYFTSSGAKTMRIQGNNLMQLASKPLTTQETADQKRQISDMIIKDLKASR